MLPSTLTSNCPRSYQQCWEYHHAKVGVRAGARTGYVIPGRDGIGGLDLAKNSSAAVVVAPPSGGAAGLAAPLDWLRQWKGREEQWKGWEEQWKGREEQWKGREEQWKGHVRVCYDYKSMLGL